MGLVVTLVEDLVMGTVAVTLVEALGLAVTLVTGAVVSLSDASGVHQVPSPMLESLSRSLCRLAVVPRSVDRCRLTALRALEE